MPTDTIRTNHRPTGARLHRRIFHLTAGSTFPTLYVFVDKELILPGAIVVACVTILLEVARLRSGHLNQIFLTRFNVLTKSSESRSLLGSTWMLIATPICIAGMDQPIAVLSLYYLSLGDPTAAIVGERFGQIRIGEKSLEGSAAFLAISVAIGALLVATTLETTFPIMIMGAGAAMLIELVPTRRIDDNLKTPLIAGVLMQVATTWLG